MVGRGPLCRGPWFPLHVGSIKASVELGTLAGSSLRPHPWLKGASGVHLPLTTGHPQPLQLPPPPRGPAGGQPTAAALVGLRCRKALQVAVPTVHWRDEHVFNSCLPESCFLSYRDEISVGGKQSWEWGL